MPKPASIGPDFFSTLVDVSTAELCAALDSVKPGEVRSVMREVAAQLLEQYAGRDVYVRKSVGEQRAERNARIRSGYAQPGPDGVAPGTGQRMAQLAAEHRLTHRQVRTILLGESAE